MYPKLTLSSCRPLQQQHPEPQTETTSRELYPKPERTNSDQESKERSGAVRGVLVQTGELQALIHISATKKPTEMTGTH